jgi:NAD(P)-dependent dehydrogenase (short-subunit alcohol dehydrogenase family)
LPLLLLREGFNLAVCSRNADELKNFEQELKDINPDIELLAIVADVSLKADVIKFAQQAESALGQINVIVNNAGMYIPTSILDDTDDTFDKLVHTNLMPAYQLYRYFGKSLIAGGYRAYF